MLKYEKDDNCDGEMIIAYIGIRLVKNVCECLCDAGTVLAKNCLFMDTDKTRDLVTYTASITNNQASVYM